ncbi:MAG: cell surface protein [Rhodobiaceae bacterium]|nr:cell surface protein [Rhodobiaceae bacterium]MCC0050960.1 cell surface protein [Rhodobiaceae bacterium]MCC0060320.1 cell surface protein [Rhodobiaceae bacterium]
MTAKSKAILDTPMQYLDRAMTMLRDVGIIPEPDSAEQPIVPLLNEISELDADKVVAIARTLTQASFFNEVVREQVAAMNIGERYEKITAGFDSIRDDAKSMVDQLADGHISTWERFGNIWMKATRGDIADRFDDIKSTYLEVAADTKDQIRREQVILDAYRDFRGALKHAEVLALEVLEKAEGELQKRKDALTTAASAVANAASEMEPAARARLELARDERMREMQDEEKRYQIAKDLSDNLTIGYNTSEVIMARLVQTTSAKDRVYAQAVSFFSTNETVLTALKASFTGMFGLHEATKTLDAMKEGISKSLETLSEVGDQVQEAAIRSGYGPTIQASSVKMLVDSVVGFQERSREIINEMRLLATKNSEEIRDAVEDGKRRLAKLAADGNALLLE